MASASKKSTTFQYLRSVDPVRDISNTRLFIMGREAALFTTQDTVSAQGLSLGSRYFDQPQKNIIQHSLSQHALYAKTGSQVSATQIHLRILLNDTACRVETQSRVISLTLTPFHRRPLPRQMAHRSNSQGLPSALLWAISSRCPLTVLD